MVCNNTLIAYPLSFLLHRRRRRFGSSFFIQALTFFSTLALAKVFSQNVVKIKDELRHDVLGANKRYMAIKFKDRFGNTVRKHVQLCEKRVKS